MQILHAQEMLAKEMSECTFRPAINEAPSYVKCMASAQKRLKENSSMYKKQVGPQTRL